MWTESEAIKMTDTVGEIVARRPALSRLFEEAGIDYCCGGKMPFEEACRRESTPRCSSPHLRKRA
jgi:regulator of cell morphogenesis and NO signaling